MFYLRKPSKVLPPLIRHATAEELYNYKNRFVLVDPPTDNPTTPDRPSDCCDNDCICHTDLVFINCELTSADLNANV